ncbi:hypothetical protein FB45DRAFT_186799 [Roridomyces roridus]|uniref:Yeast cell wall synthesis Kre9/Knh1-like N-terminal domain-containing protein n=1 Tax=Roridomyces roridus TaxID=1738132 RepID=A0AAD7FWC2_9AGAR|nr:hypothetical protein FB45DRAFT_186799 [Roridomyces roridus]
MHFPWLLAALVALDFSLLASAGVFFIEPASGSTCTAGSPCTMEWVEDGISPLLNAVDLVTAGLFHGEQQLVQSIAPLNVANGHSVQFTPNAKAGPDSSAYYIAFQSTSARVNSTKYIAFSPFFTLKGMSGSFESPLAAATSSIPIPSTLSQASSGGGSIATTIVIGAPPSSSVSPSPTPAVVSASSKSSSPSAAAVSTSSSSPSINSPSPSSGSSFSSRFTTSSIPTPSTASNSVASSPAPVASSPAPAASSDARSSSRPLSLPVLAIASLWLVLSI